MAEPDAARSPFRFFVFTCRDTATDFRLPLAGVLRERGETWYIWLRRQPRVWSPDGSMVGHKISFPALLRLLRKVTTPDLVNVYFNTTNASFPIIMVLLRFVCGRGVWCLDMHDDLLYTHIGFRRWREWAAVQLQLLAADVVVRAAESLKELFPRSLPFGNASQIAPITRPDTDYRRVLVMASLDPRFDFDFMGAVAAACPDRHFAIYGQVSMNDPATAASLDMLCRSHTNVSYHGAYGLADLIPILSRYSVSLAPYVLGIRLTRYIDPLRFYHCLNSGMELITTAIPQARHLTDALHVVGSAEEVATVLARLEIDSGARRNRPGRYEPQTWAQRADRLIAILKTHPKALRLLKSRLVDRSGYASGNGISPAVVDARQDS